MIHSKVCYCQIFSNLNDYRKCLIVRIQIRYLKGIDGALVEITVTHEVITLCEKIEHIT